MGSEEDRNSYKLSMLEWRGKFGSWLLSFSYFLDASDDLAVNIRIEYKLTPVTELSHKLQIWYTLGAASIGRVQLSY